MNSFPLFFSPFPSLFLENYTPPSLSSWLPPKPDNSFSTGLKHTHWQVCHKSRLARRCQDEAGEFHCPVGSRESPPSCEGSNLCTRSLVTRGYRMPSWGKLWEGEEQKEAFDSVDPFLKWSSRMNLQGHQESYRQREKKDALRKAHWQVSCKAVVPAECW